MEEEPATDDESSWLGESSVTEARNVWLDSWRQLLHSHGYARLPAALSEGDDGSLDRMRDGIRFVQAVRFATLCETRGAPLHYRAPPHMQCNGKQVEVYREAQAAWAQHVGYEPKLPASKNGRNKVLHALKPWRARGRGDCRSASVGRRSFSCCPAVHTGGDNYT